MDRERTWDAVAVASAAAAAVLTRRLLKSGWSTLRGDEPPTNPAARSVTWGDALAWTVVSGVTVGLARLLAQRGAASGWKKLQGSYPEGLD